MPGAAGGFHDEPRPVAMAHRGGATYPPNIGIENTLTAFRNAVSLGYRWLETDVHASADGELFAFHDPTLDRMTDRTGRIGELSAAEVRSASVLGHEHVPTLEELLVELPTTRFNVDVKSVGAVAALAAMLERTGAHDRLCVASFSYARLRAVRRLRGSPLTTSLAGTEVALLRLAPLRAGRRLALRGSGVAAQVPERRGPMTVVTPGFVAEAHRLGIAVHVWTVDEPEAMHRLLDLGVDGLISDRIDVLRDVLTARGQWTGDVDVTGDR